MIRVIENKASLHDAADFGQDLADSIAVYSPKNTNEAVLTRKKSRLPP